MGRVRTGLLSLLLAGLVAGAAWAQPVVEAVSSTGTVAGTGTTLDIGLPTGTTSGDLLVACMRVTAGSGETADFSSTGWTHVLTGFPGGVGGDKVGVLYKFYSGSDSPPYTFTLVSTASPNRRGLMWRISGADATPSDATATYHNGTTGTTRTHDSITTATNNALVLGCLSWSSNDATYTPDASFTNDVTQNRHAGDHVVQATAGATGNFTGSGSTATFGSILWAVKPGTVNTAPSVALSGPADLGTVTTLTPALTFVCTDPDADACRVNVQITDNPADFVGGEAVTDSNTAGSVLNIHPQPDAALNSPTTGNIQTDDRLCQAFTGDGGTVTKASFWFGEDDVDHTATNGAYVYRLYTIAGTYGTDARPSAAPAPSPAGSATNGTNTPTTGWVAVSDSVAFVHPTDETETWRDGSFTGANIYRTTNTTKYMVCLDWIPNNRTLRNTITSKWTTTDTHGGNAWIDGDSANYGDGSADQIFGGDAWFRVYTTFVLTDVVSGTDAGFSGTGGEPYTSGTTTTYTVQSALTNGITYYWRARGIDPTGSNTYGSWSTTRSFTVNVAVSAGISKTTRGLLLGIGSGGGGPQ